MLYIVQSKLHTVEQKKVVLMASTLLSANNPTMQCAVFMDAEMTVLVHTCQ